MSRTMKMEYAVYKGEDLVCMGNAKECADFLECSVNSFRFYLTPSYRRRIEKRKNPKNYITVVNLDEDEE